jgi:hypothetical protein
VEVSITDATEEIKMSAEVNGLAPAPFPHTPAA